jgi:hypothetical protein
MGRVEPDQSLQQPNSSEEGTGDSGRHTQISAPRVSAGICARIFRTDSFFPLHSLMAAFLAVLPGMQFGHYGNYLYGCADTLGKIGACLIQIFLLLLIG